MTSDQKSLVTPARKALARSLHTVPFVEMFGGRVQGVVSSGSDPARVYVSSVEAKTFATSCSTNNNRPCGGLRGPYCKHIQEMVEQAVSQYGADHVAGYLQLDGEAAHYKSTYEIMTALSKSAKPSKGDAGTVFARFLSYLRYVELPPSSIVIPEMSWFTGG